METEHFLYPEQLSQIEDVKIESNFVDILADIECPAQFVNFCVNPKLTYEDELSYFFDESSVERRIDRMLNVESLGIADTSDEISLYDKEKIEQFEKGIDVVNNQFHVELVWHDNIKDVPSNYEVALKVLETVSRKLDKAGTLDTYNQVFLDKLE